MDINWHGQNEAEKRLVESMAQDIQAEIDRQLLDDLRALSGLPSHQEVQLKQPRYRSIDADWGHDG